MNNETLLNLKDISLEVVIISLLVFGLTMLIKWPIKKSTAKLEENKRKAVNTVIVFIPMILSLILNILYSGIFKKVWFSSEIIDKMVSCYLLAVVIYACFSRVIVIIKGVRNTTPINNDLSKETIKFIKQNIKVISNTLKVDESKLSEITKKIEETLKIRSQLLNNIAFQDVATVEKIDRQIAELDLMKSEIEKSMEDSNSKLTFYKGTITCKGEK